MRLLRRRHTLLETALHLVDHNRGDNHQINRSSFTRLGALELVHSFITDDGISDRDAKEFERRGIQMLIAE